MVPRGHPTTQSAQYSGVIVTMSLLARNFRTLRTVLSAVVAKSPKRQNRLINFPHLGTVSPQVFLVTRNLASKSHSNKKKDNRHDSDSDSDSDDEVDHYSHRGESEFWRRKMRTLHRILDVNKDGVLSFDDFLLFSDRFNDLAHMTERHHGELKKLMQEVWEAQYGPVDPYNLVTTEQFLEEMHHALNDKPLRKKIHKFLPYLFKAVDKDRKGEITVEEFKLFFKCLGLENEEALVSFHAIDENADGRVSIREFIHLGKDFFLSEDESKTSKLFWGPLVHH